MPCLKEPSGRCILLKKKNGTQSWKYKLKINESLLYTQPNGRNLKRLIIPNAGEALKQPELSHTAECKMVYYLAKLTVSAEAIDASPYELTSPPKVKSEKIAYIPTPKKPYRNVHVGFVHNKPKTGSNSPSTG